MAKAGVLWVFIACSAAWAGQTAVNPIPSNGATRVAVGGVLSWTAGDSAVSHDVYFGTNSSAVTIARRLLGDINGNGAADISDLAILAGQWLTTPGVVNPSADIVFSSLVDFEDFAALAADWQEPSNPLFKGNQTGTIYDPGMLTQGTTYYWRVDEVNPSSPDSPWAGPVWSFTTGAPPAAATNPSPADGAMDVDVDAILSWTVGTGATLHKLYGGTTNPPPYVTTLASATFDPTLAAHTTYYWRIDEVNSFGTTVGPVWTFTTGAAVQLGSDFYSDTWVAADALGRELPRYEECGPPRSDRYVALFYFLWLGEHGTGGPYDITKLLAANPYDPSWGSVYAFHHWGESELGYYLSNDQWVMRKHAYLLANAGIDVIVFDVTNGFTYSKNYLPLCSVFSDIRAHGGTTPRIAFMANTYGDNVVQSLYDNLYAPGLYSDLWFIWKGKPLVLAPLDGMEVGGRTITYSQTIQDFFSMRYTWAWTGGQDIWNWIDNYPQRYGWHESSSLPEEASVCVGHHPVSNKGRSFHSGSQPAHDEYGLTGYEDLGLNFTEQSGRLSQIDPELLFITGWNEWAAQRFLAPSGGMWFLGELVPEGGTYFVDQYNHEFSRDIEPMKGGHTDNYYYQMIDGIRRYKGVRRLPVPSAPKTIVIDGGFTDWADVGPDYRDWPGDTQHRNSVGWGSAGPYINTTGRNDFVGARVARDDTYVHFFIQTDAAITSYTGSNWMLLFINADQNYSTGWQGYDYVVNMGVTDSTTTTLKHTSSGWNWTNVSTNIPYRTAGNKMEIRVPRSSIGQGSGSATVAFDFHWADNIQANNDILQFAISGDSAPDRRFNYRYDTTTVNALDIVNSSFEYPNVSTYQYTPSGTDWNHTGNGFVIANKGSAFGNSSYYGHQVLVLQQVVSASRAVSGFTVGKQYQVRWAEADRPGSLGGNTLRVLIDGTVVGTLHTVTNDSWVVKTSTAFTATAATHTLKFDATNSQGGDRSVFIDAVAITEMP